jgi:hypothetical protein
VSLPDLLELSLDLLDALIFEVLNLLQGVLDNSQGLGINLSSSEQLVNLCVLSLKRLLDGFEFLLLNQVPKPSFLVDLVHMVMERVEKLLLLSLEILERLESDLVLPTDILQDGGLLSDVLLSHDQVVLDLLVPYLFLSQPLFLLFSFLQRPLYLLVLLLLVRPLSLLSGIFLPGLQKVGFQLLDNV